MVKNVLVKSSYPHGLPPQIQSNTNLIMVICHHLVTQIIGVKLTP